jgi:hypothetical protein
MYCDTDKEIIHIQGEERVLILPCCNISQLACESQETAKAVGMWESYRDWPGS